MSTPKMVILYSVLHLVPVLSAALSAGATSGGSSGVTETGGEFDQGKYKNLNQPAGITMPTFPKDQHGTDVVWHTTPVVLDPKGYGGPICWHLIFDEPIYSQATNLVQAWTTVDEGNLADGASSPLPKEQRGLKWHDVEYLYIRPRFSDAPGGGNGPTTNSHGHGSSGTSTHSSSGGYQGVTGGKTRTSWLDYGAKGEDYPGSGISGLTREVTNTGSSGDEIPTLEGYKSFAGVQGQAYAAGQVVPSKLRLWSGYDVCLIVQPGDTNGIILHTNVLGWGGSPSLISQS